MSRVVDLYRRIPVAGRVCALLAFLNAFAWALITPPFHVPDESVHFGYAQYVAENFDLPSDTPGRAFSTEEQAIIDAARTFSVAGNPNDKPIWSESEETRFDHAREAGLAPDDAGGKTVATGNPPLYYLANAVVYRLTPSGDLLTRLYAMRLLSAVLAALTVLFTFMFLRELLPGTPWAWTVGALAVAFQPMFSFESGGVNNDNALFVCVAWLFWIVARSMRHGLTRGRGISMGLALAAGGLSSIKMTMFIPVVVLALAYMLWQSAPERRRAMLATIGVMTVVAAIPVVVYVGANHVIFDRPLLAQGTLDGSPGPPARHPANLREQASYTWQLFLPRLPFMSDTFPGTQPLWDTWFTGFNGRFGLLDTSFSAAYYRWIFILVYLPIIVLAALALWRRRDALRRWGPQFLIYGSSILGLLWVVGGPSYSNWLTNSDPFQQPRYVLPLLPLFAAIVALAVRGAGRRYAPAVGAAIVMLALMHSLFAQLLTLTRFYA